MNYCIDQFIVQVLHMQLQVLLVPEPVRMQVLWINKHKCCVSVVLYLDSRENNWKRLVPAAFVQVPGTTNTGSTGTLAN